MRRALPTLLTFSVLAVAGCSPTDPAVVKQTPAVQAPPSAATRATTAPVTAGAVVKKIKAADLGLTNVAVQDEDTDPNNLLGRPNGYVSRASADLPGGNRQADPFGVDRGLVVETFADAAAAKRRSDYIQGLLQGAPMLGSEWHYTADGGRALVRVSGKVKPSLAKKIEAATNRM
jgi:hypothetical protein